MIRSRARTLCLLLLVLAGTGCEEPASTDLPGFDRYTDGVSLLVEALGAALAESSRGEVARLCEEGARAAPAETPAGTPFVSPSGLQVRRFTPGASRVPAAEALLARRGAFETLARRDLRIARIEGRGPRRRALVHVRLAGLAGGARLQEESWWEIEVVREEPNAPGWRIASAKETRRVAVHAPRALFRARPLPGPRSSWSPVSTRPEDSLNIAAAGDHDSGGLAVLEGDDARACVLIAGGEGLRAILPPAPGVEGRWPRVGDAQTGIGRGLGETKGLLAADLDNDGTRDLFVSCDRSPCRLYRGEPGPAAAEGAGGLSACGAAFRDVTAGSGVESLTGPYRSVVALDADRDGRLDVYLVQYGDGTRTGPSTSGRNGLANRFFRNISVPGGPIRFRDETLSSGTGDAGWGLAAAAADYDGDGKDDLYVANDFGRNVLYRNVTRAGGPVRFVDVSRETGTLDPGFGMGATWGDYDRDGDLDLYVSNYWMDEAWIVRHPLYPLPEYHLSRLLAPIIKRKLSSLIRGNSLFRNEVARTGRFERVSDEAGVFDGGWAWGSIWLDADGDGLEDLAVANGMLRGATGRGREIDFWNRMSQGWKDFSSGRWTIDFGPDGIAGPQTERLFLNLGDGTFAEIGWAAGLDGEEDLRGLVASDVTGDGAPDIVGAAFLGPPLVYANLDAGSPGRVRVRLTGSASNREAVGAIVRLAAAGRVQTRQVAAGGSFLSDAGRILAYGLGPGAPAIEWIEVRWPSGRRTHLASPRARDGLIAIHEEDAEPPPGSPPAKRRIETRQGQWLRSVRSAPSVAYPGLASTPETTRVTR